MKNFVYVLLMMILSIPTAIANEYTNEAEIDLDSIKFNKSNNTSEIKMKIYNENYIPGNNEMYYALYYLKMDCNQKMYKPIITEGYNKFDELMLVDYEPRPFKPVITGSNMEQAYNYACKVTPIPDEEK